MDRDGSLQNCHDQSINLEGEIAGVRRGGWKYIRPGRIATWGEFVTDETQLFNLAEDPGETNNLAARRPGKVAELEAVVRSFEETLE